MGLLSIGMVSGVMIVVGAVGSFASFVAILILTLTNYFK